MPDIIDVSGDRIRLPLRHRKTQVFLLRCNLFEKRLLFDRGPDRVCGAQTRDREQKVLCEASKHPAEGTRDSQLPEERNVQAARNIKFLTGLNKTSSLFPLCKGKLG